MPSRRSVAVHLVMLVLAAPLLAVGAAPASHGVIGPCRPFSTETRFPAGTSPQSVTTADFDEDGLLDLATPDDEGEVGGLSILLGDGAGGFSAAGTVALAADRDGPNAVVSADLDGDEHVDLAVTNRFFFSGLSVFLGDGSGGFQPGVVIDRESPDGLGVGDADNDGDADLFVTNGNATILGLMLGDGTGGFAEAPGSPYPVGTDVPNGLDLAVADLNGDGNDDAAVASGDEDTIAVLLGTGTGSLAAAGAPLPVGDEPRSVAIDDLNNDANPDLVTVNLRSLDMTVLLGDGTGDFAEAAASRSPWVPRPRTTSRSRRPSDASTQAASRTS